MDESAIKSVYVPDYCLDGSDLPGHITWDKEIRLKIRVVLGEQLEVKNVYNVPKDGLKVHDGFLELDDFEVNGYVAFLFVPHIGKEVRQFLTLKFEFTSEDGAKPIIVTREVKVFRPKIKMIEVPKEIKVFYDKQGKRWVAEPKIQLENEGEGTGLISFEFKESLGAEISPPSKVDEFIRGFLNDFRTRLTNTGHKFPQYSSLIDSYFKFLEESDRSPKKDLSGQVKSWAIQLAQSFRTDEDFRDAIVEDIYIAYIANVEVITEMKSFLEYINSIAEGKIMLTNSLDYFSINVKEAKVTPVVTLKDLAYNEYEPLELPSIKVLSDENTSLPLLNLFQWKQPNLRSADSSR